MWDVEDALRGAYARTANHPLLSSHNEMSRPVSENTRTVAKSSGRLWNALAMRRMGATATRLRAR